MTMKILVLLICLLVYPMVSFSSSGGIPALQPKKQVDSSDEKQQVSQPKVDVTTPVKIQPAKQTKNEIAQDRAADARRRQIESLKNSLGANVWTIEVTSMDAKKRQSVDNIAFTDRKIRLENLLKKGFAPTNYSITVKDSGGLVIETMQRKDNNDIVFLKAEMTPSRDKIQGVMNYQSPGKSENFSFVGSISETSVEELPW